jgi:malate dehydrogenase
MRSTAQALKMAFQASREMASRAPKDRKVAVLGAAGGIGQPLSLLMKVQSRSTCLIGT